MSVGGDGGLGVVVVGEAAGDDDDLVLGLEDDLAVEGLRPPTGLGVGVGGVWGWGGLGGVRR